MSYRTISYTTCHRCKGENDRGSQRTCKSCHALIQREHREKKARGVDELVSRVYKLEEQLAVALARAVAAEAQLVVFRALREVSRETRSVAA